MPRDPEALRHWRPEPATHRETEAMVGLERGDFEIYRNKMELVCWEAYQTFSRMGISPMIEAGDAAVGIYTRQGDLAVGIMGTQLHLINASIGIKWMMRWFYEEPSVGIHEGDMFYANDPLYGGIHAPDQILFLPVFWEGELVAWAAAASHETETGASEPGGNPPSAKTRYDEGMLLSPIKIAENYELKADLMEMMENRVRDPRMQTLDTKARAAAVHILERRVHEIIDRKGVDFLIGAMRRMIDEGIAAARAKLSTMNDGTYRTSVFLENAGEGKYGLISCQVEVEKRGDEAFIRFRGSPRVIGGNFNMFPHMMIAMFACYLFQFFFWELPATTGYYEPFHFEFQDGSFFMADPEDATSLGVATHAQVLTGVHVAMEKMKFGSPFHDHVVGSWPGTSNSMATAGIGKDGMPFAAWDQGVPNGIGMGARWDSDGIDVGGFIWCAIGEFLDSEAIEHSFPLLPVFRSVFWKDAVGYGKYRGGRSMNSMYQVHGVPGVAAVSMGGISGRPLAPGLFGGYPSRPCATAFIRNHNLDELVAEHRTPSDVHEAVERVTGDWEVRHQNSGMGMLAEGDMYIGVAPSGPGYGDVLERDPELVMKDLREQAISHRTAREIFHVVYREDNLVVDAEATELARKEERERRLARALPYDQWLSGWLDRRPPDRVMEMYGEWPYGMSTPLTDWEPSAELLDEHVREGGEPRPKPSRY
ncbi:MAG: hydantoinase B/oxoprolinase family protein [Actinomycetota bacterium]|nr:hydantoinase B/oxoprolinase family protein [Actinomycetota bacterium]